MDTSYAKYNSRNIFELFTSSRALFLCLDALDMVDGKGAPNPKMKIRCCNYSTNLDEGERITCEVPIYLPISRFLLLSHEIISGNCFARKRLAASTAAKYPVYFEQLGGTKNGGVVATRFSLVDGRGENASFAFLATAIPGKVTQKGGIVPIDGDAWAKANRENSIYINIPDDKLVEFALIGKAYAEQYIAHDLQSRLDIVRKQRQKYAAR